MTKKIKSVGDFVTTNPTIAEGQSPGLIPGAPSPTQQPTEAPAEAPSEAPTEAPVESKEMEELRKRADELFELHPAAAELYFTADGTAFFMKGNADLHAKNIGNTQIITIKCKEV